MGRGGRQKKSSQADTKSQSKNSIKAATISITGLLTIVKEMHQSILSGDVLAHFGEERDPNGDYAGNVDADSPQKSKELLREIEKLSPEQTEHILLVVRDLARR